jgi:hypothetical protein
MDYLEFLAIILAWVGILFGGEKAIIWLKKHW